MHPPISASWSFSPAASSSSCEILCAISLDASVGSAAFFCFPFLPGTAPGGAGAGRLSWPAAGCPFAWAASGVGWFGDPFATGVAGRGATVAEAIVGLAKDIGRCGLVGGGGAVVSKDLAPGGNLQPHTAFSLSWSSWRGDAACVRACGYGSQASPSSFFRSGGLSPTVGRLRREGGRSGTRGTAGRLFNQGATAAAQTGMRPDAHAGTGCTLWMPCTEGNSKRLEGDGQSPQRVHCALLCRLQYRAGVPRGEEKGVRVAQNAGG